MAWIWSVRKAMVWVLCGLVAAQAAAGTALAALPGGGAFVHGEGEIAYAPDGSADGQTRDRPSRDPVGYVFDRSRSRGRF